MMQAQPTVCPRARIANGRIAWLDIAKGIAILCTIIGHTFPTSRLVRKMIFSFHMPLFFFLAGYTTHATSHSFARIKKDFRRLVLPALGVELFFRLITNQLYGQGLLFGCWDFLRRLLWGNGLNYTFLSANMYGFGAFWFLLALFYCKIIYRWLLNKMPVYRALFLLLGAYISMEIGNIVHLPQCLDLLFVGMLFMEGGYQLRQCGKEDGAAIKAAGLVAFVGWVTLAHDQGIYIEMAKRYYPGMLLCIGVAFMGCLWVVQLSKTLSALNATRGGGGIAFIGRYSLALLCIHDLDTLFMPLWNWPLFPVDSPYVALNVYCMSLVRILLDVGILLVWLCLRNQIRRWWQGTHQSKSVEQ